VEPVSIREYCAVFLESLITHDESEDEYQCAQEFQLEDYLSRSEDEVFPNDNHIFEELIA